MNSLIDQILSIIFLVLGFGFVIFFHELGHFLAAKWVGIKVEQFAVGFGHAMLAWRKGVGIRIGSTQKDYERRVQEHLDATRSTARSQEAQVREKVGYTAEQYNHAAEELGVGETEYRLNWIPLGGYVKMLGQDDLKANAQQDDPRAYNRKSIGARMVVVSAGVIMNIILAAIGFMIVFMMGFRAPPAVVGNVLPDSPASKAGVRVGDRILYFDDKWQHDFTKISLNTALVEDGAPVPMYVRHANGKEESLTITPQRPKGEAKGFLSLGVGQILELRGVDPKDKLPDNLRSTQLIPAEAMQIDPGDEVIEIDGKKIDARVDYPKLDTLIQKSYGKPVSLTVKKANGTIAHIDVWPHFEDLFTKDMVNIAGMVPRASIQMVTEESPARGKILPGDAIADVSVNSESNPKHTAPSRDELMKMLNAAGQAGKTIDLTVVRGGKTVDVKDLNPGLKLDKGRRGLGIQLGYDESNPVIADVMQGSAADKAGIQREWRVTSVAGQPVSTWFDVHRLLATNAKPDATIAIQAKNFAGDEERTFELHLDANQIAAMQPDQHWYTNSLVYVPIPTLHERVEPRIAKNPLQAAEWGVTETRDFVLQFYLTLKRMFQGSVSYTNMMGPVGIFGAGIKFAYKGNDWLIWFLSMISANLAVVNFLPIPIVDGGLFTFLILEKLMGKPLSPKAQSIAQVVGLALILGVFLLVTYQDIARYF